MKNLLKKYRHSEEGFTLIELIIVIAILAIIAAIAIPNIIGAVDDSRKTADIANAKVIANAAAQAKAQNDSFADKTGTFKIEDSSSDSYVVEVVKALNSSVPIPKYKGTDETENNFYLKVDVNSIKVYVGSSDATTDLIMVYPTPATDYK